MMWFYLFFIFFGHMSFMELRLHDVVLVVLHLLGTREFYGVRRSVTELT